MKMISMSKWSTAGLRDRALWVTLATLLLGGQLAFAQVNRSLGSLPPGGVVSITFDVTINTNFPVNTSSVTNQGSLSGTGFGPILTDDPATAALNDPTVTAITVAPKISCPPNIITNGFSACQLPSLAFSATVTGGAPPPTLIYKIGSTVISSPYIFPTGTNTVSVTATNGTAPDAACSFTVTVMPTAPVLNIVQVTTNVVLSWPGAFSCYTLQYSAALGATNSWTAHPGPFTAAGGNIYVTNAVALTNRCFRLSY